MRKFFADTTPLRTPDFRRLWLTGIVTVIGGNLTIFAVPVQLYALTQNSAYVGLSGLFALVPLIVFGLLGGAWADAMPASHSRRKSCVRSGVVSAKYRRTRAEAARCGLCSLSPAPRLG